MFFFSVVPNILQERNQIKIKIKHNQVKVLKECSTIIYLSSKLSPALPQMVLNANSRFYPALSTQKHVILKEIKRT